MIEPTHRSHHTPPHAAGTRYSADELVRMREDVTALLTFGMKTAASRTLELMQPPAPDDLHTLAESLRQDLLQAHAIFATRGPQAVRELTRVGCNALRLYRAYHRVCCRKARTCRGDAAACLNHASVPEPAREWARRLMVAELAPWLPRLGGRDVERAAYEGWVAGIEARRA